MGGRFGDFMHSLVVCDYLYKFYSKKVNLYIGNVNDEVDHFWNGPEYTRNDLLSVMLKQPYINSFEVYAGQQMDFYLSSFRTSIHIDKCGWTDLFLKTFLPIDKRIKDNVVIHTDVLEEYKDIVVIHERPERSTMDAYPLYESLVNNYECVFLTQIDWWYDEFSLKHKVKRVIPQSGVDLLNILNSCKYYIGNQTGVTAAAHMLNTPRTIICRNREHSTGVEIKLKDQMHYIGELPYYSNLSVFISDEEHYMSPLSLLNESLLK